MFYENNNLQFVIKKGSCAKKYFKSIEQYIMNFNLALTPKICNFVCEIDEKHRDIRIKLVHNATEVVQIDNTALQIDKNILIEFLEMVKSILLDINEKLEIIHKQLKVSV